MFAVAIPITITLVHACGSNTDIGIIHPYLAVSTPILVSLDHIFNLKTIAVASLCHKLWASTLQANWAISGGLGWLEMSRKIPSSFFDEASWKVKKKSNVRTKRITNWPLKCHKRFLQFFLLMLHERSRKNQCKDKTLYHSLSIHERFLQLFFWSFMKSQKKNPTKHITNWPLKCHKRSLQFFCWSFMKVKEKNQCKDKTFYHSLGIEIPWQISSLTFCFIAG